MMIFGFVPKPCVIYATQFDSESNVDFILEWMADNDHYDTRYESPYLIISTLEGEMKASLGDWIVRGLSGEFYPVKPEIMDMKYEKQPIEKFPEIHITNDGESEA